MSNCNHTPCDHTMLWLVIFAMAMGWCGHNHTHTPDEIVAVEEVVE